MPSFHRAPMRRSFSGPPSMRRQLSDEAVQLLTTGLDGFSISDDIFELDFMFDEPLLHEDDFVQMFQSDLRVWYNQKTREEKEWLNANNDAKQMVTLMLNGLDNLMKVNGV